MGIEMKPQKAAVPAKGRGKTGSNLAGTVATLVLLSLAFAPKPSPAERSTSIAVTSLRAKPDSTVILSARLFTGPVYSNPLRVPQRLQFYVGPRGTVDGIYYPLRFVGSAVTDGEGVAKVPYQVQDYFSTRDVPGLHAFIRVQFEGIGPYQGSAGHGLLRVRSFALPGDPEPEPWAAGPGGPRLPTVSRPGQNLPTPHAPAVQARDVPSRGVPAPGI